MNTEIQNTLGRINAQVDNISETYNKGLSDARKSGLAILKSCGWFHHALEESTIILKDMKS